MVLDFFKNLVRSRVEGIRSKANAKVYGAKARAQSKVANKFNKAVDKPMEAAAKKAKEAGAKAKEKAKGGKADDAKPDKADKADKADAKQEKGEKVGLFSKKPTGGGNSGKAAPASKQQAQEDFDPGMKTQAIDISGMVDERAQDVVGWIVCLNGALRGRDFRLVTGRNVLGTAADCDIVLTDPYLSSKHMAIRHENGTFTLIDLDSTNGTFVNDRRVTKQELIDNDKVRIGRTEMKFKSLF